MIMMMTMMIVIIGSSDGKASEVFATKLDSLNPILRTPINEGTSCLLTFICVLLHVFAPARVCTCAHRDTYTKYIDEI